MAGMVLVFWAGVCCAQQAEKEKAAAEAALSWLALVDAGSYAASWQSAALYFRNAVTQELWEQSMKSIRQPLGAVNGRQVRSAQYMTEMPGAPDGEYVVVLMETSFQNKKNAMETVTPMLDADGQWRVSGYYIK